MDLTRTAFGIWSGGRFMHFGEKLEEDRFLDLIRMAHGEGVRSFVTADVYGEGEADRLLGRGLQGLDRDSYCLVGTIGHDFYEGRLDGAKGFPRFTNPDLRGPDQYGSYLREATEKSLERCGVSRFDLLLLHNPDSIGYTSEVVWKGMAALKDAGLADRVGIAPGPANGFTLDLIRNFERFEGLVEWAMVILNPMEPWPGGLCLPAAAKHGVKVLTRVVDCGGLFHDDVRPGHRFGTSDHRVFRPAGWVEGGVEKLERMRPVAERHGLTMLQLACLWNLGQPAVESVVPTLIQETEGKGKPIGDKLRELARLPDIRLSDDELAFLAEAGDNKGCMHLKGGNPEHEGVPVADRWSLDADLVDAGRRWGIDPARDLVMAH